MGNCGSCSDLCDLLFGTSQSGAYDESTPMMKTKHIEGSEEGGGFARPMTDEATVREYHTTNHPPNNIDPSAVAFNTTNASVYSSGPKSSSFHFNYELKEEIGVGSTSKCYNCIKKADGSEYACKVIDKRQVELKFSGLLEQFFTEIKVLKTLQHPNIIRFEDTYETNDRIYIIMELMKGGELFDYVVEKGTLSEEEASLIVRKITSAVAHMHGMNIIHRDLKPENLLLTSKGPEAAVKLIDFGLAKVMRETVASSFLGGWCDPCLLACLLVAYRHACISVMSYRTLHVCISSSPSPHAYLFACGIYHLTYCRYEGLSSSRDVASTLLRQGDRHVVTGGHRVRATVWLSALRRR